MKGYYIWAPLEPGCLGNGSGIEKKVRAQVDAFKEYFDVTLEILQPREYHRTDKFVSRLPFGPVGNRWRYQGELTGADFIYIRQVRHDAFFLRYLKAIKKANSRVKIIYEIPTYPYEDEQSVKLKNIHIIVKDRFHRRFLRKYVDRIVTFYGQPRIFGIQTLNIRNGFDFSSVPVKNKIADKGIINIIEVSTTAFWHGYDRFLCGLQEYYKKGGTRNIVFHMVGIILPEHEQYVEQNRLKEHVVFHGILSGTELEQVYEKCVAGVDVLGGHRKNYPISSSLKSREYSAYGLPVITASPIDYIEEDYPYQLIVPYNDSPVNMQNVIEFIDKCYENQDENEVSARIREYGYQHCDMRNVIKPVVEYIES